MSGLRTSWRRFLAAEDGNSTIEFLFVFPFLIVIFCASFESSFFMIRNVSLERSVDLVVRDLRLGTLGAVTHANLKREICDRAAVLGSLEDCRQAMRIELLPVDTAVFNMPSVPVECVDRREPIDPLVEEPNPDDYELGDSNQIMLMRVCLQADPMFATTVFFARMNTTGPDGGYSITTTTTFVNEPRT
jgi:hypothetical protein